MNMESRSENAGEIILYNVNEKISLEVRLEQETVWLNQSQMAELFQTTKQNISLHISNCFKDNELQRDSVVKIFLTTASDGKQYKTFMYNLDVIISVGYRVKSIRGTQFRQWANKVLKDYLLKGYSINYQIASIQENLQNHTSQIRKLQEQVDFFVQTSLPPVQGIFYNGQIFDAYKFASDLIRSANKRIVLIDNYIDDTILTMFDKRKEHVEAKIFTSQISKQLHLDVSKHNEQYRPIEIKIFRYSHDRFLIIDSCVYLIGASLKDLGKKMFAFSKLEIAADDFVTQLQK